MPKTRFTADRFVVTQHSTAEEKARFCNEFVRFVLAGFPHRIFKPAFYRRLSIPPCVVFVDEVHGLPRDIRDGLLKAIESKDRMLCIEGGWYADCHNVCWVVATTERGKLFGPFDSRFTKVELEMYGNEEIAAIVNLDHPAWNLPLCRLVARYASRVPREALDFAKAMEQEHDLNGGDWESVAARVARRLKIDRYGLTRRRLNVLMALVKLPPLPPDQYEALRQNIAVNGVLVPILVDSDGPKRRIIDGNYRKRIATELGYDCPEVVHQGDDEELRTLARALNLARRQMTTDQKRQVIAAQLRETPTRTNRWVAKMLGVTHPTVASVRAVGG